MSDASNIDQLTDRARQLCRAVCWRRSLETNSLVYYSPDWEEIFGTDPNDLFLGYEAMCRVVHPEDRQHVIDVYRAADSARSGFKLHYRVVRPDGSVRRVREIADVECDESGRPVFQVGVVQDITDLGAIVGAPQAAGDVYRAFLEASNEGIWRAELRRAMPLDLPVTAQVVHLSESAFISECNRAYAELHGLGDPADLVGRPLTQVMPFRGAQGADLLRELVEGGLRLSGKQTFWSSGEEEPASAMHNVVGVTGDGYLVSLWGTCTDITALQRREQGLRERASRLRDFAESAADWFWELDADLRLRPFPGDDELRCGLRSEAVAGKTLEELFEGGVFESEDCSTQLADIAARRAFSGLELRYRSPDGARRVARLNGRPHFLADGALGGYRCTGVDCTEAHRVSRQLAYEATHDNLTGLVNRAEFERRLGRALATVHELGGEHAMCYLDLDWFKTVNDTSGHAAGDFLLRQLGGVLTSTARQRDTVARLGGDEFGVLLEHCSLDQARRVASDLREAVAAFRFNWDGRTYRVGVSIGVVIVTQDSISVAELLRQADNACYAAKRSGRNQVRVFRGVMADAARGEDGARWATELKDALEQGRFWLAAQRVDPVEPGAPRHLEVLVRLRARDGSDVTPEDFLPMAERCGFTESLDAWVLGELAKRMPQLGRDLGEGGLVFANISGNSLVSEVFRSRVIESISEAPSLCSRLCVEVSESAVTANLPNAIRFAGELESIGCKLALDGFGGGLSSFAYLRSLPVDFLKIDEALVRDVARDRVAVAMVRSINEVAHAMGRLTVAKGVEDTSVLDGLRELGVDYVQGYALGPPVAI